MIKNKSHSHISLDGISDMTFSRFSSFVQAELGIKMPPMKKIMLQSRLMKRLRKLGLKSYEEYYDYVFKSEDEANELSNMIDVITTNKTGFFREPVHFDYLVKTALPELVKSKGVGIERPVMIWSAGCSTGEEPYTLAMVLSDFAEKYSRFNYSIFGTDISKKVLNEAMLGIYNMDDIEPIPMAVRKKYLLKSKDKKKPRVRIVPRLRSVVTFSRLNFMEDDYNIRRKSDIVFCRNVLIYFNRQIQERVLNRICHYLNPGGYVFMGHAETLNGIDVPLIPVGPTISRKVL